ncbi:LysE family translocator [Sphingomonas bacterium]|uniref:LysE family translocator n=1 Tax=Sphingomonas bacterium TaxID=1895847 RepID=UPI001575B22A|nr:LysE family translocator [Sphingomonas bacterium]
MTAGSWWLYAVTVFLVSATPGPNMLHVMTRSIEHGARSLWAMAGCLTAVLLALLASAAGLASLLAAFPRLFDALRYAGVAYLVWLGIASWRAGDGPRDPAGVDTAKGVSAGRLYRDALLTGLSNPKLIVFAGALFPQFIAPQLPQLLLLVTTFAVIESGWYAAYALGGRRLARHLTRPGRQRLFNRATGALFVAFGAGLLAARA